MHKNKNVRQLHIRGHVTGARSSATPDSKRQMNAEHLFAPIRVQILVTYSLNIRLEDILQQNSL